MAKLKEELYTDGKEIEVKIESIASTGSGVGFFIEDDLKKSVFVPLTVPGDTVRIKFTRKFKRYYEAKLLEIIEESPSRRKPICKHFGICGACDFLHIKYEKQLESKELLLKHNFTRNDIALKELSVIPAKNEYNYRHKARLAIGAKKVDESKTFFGFRGKRSNEVVEIEECHIINKELNKLFSIQPSIRSSRKKDESFAFDFMTKTVISENDTKKCFYQFEDTELAYYPDSFVQSNLEMNEELVKTIIANISGKEILDLYSGNGNFTLPMANSKDKESVRVTAIEGDKKGY